MTCAQNLNVRLFYDNPVVSAYWAPYRTADNGKWQPAAVDPFPVAQTDILGYTDYVSDSQDHGDHHQMFLSWRKIDNITALFVVVNV